MTNPTIDSNGAHHGAAGTRDGGKFQAQNLPEPSVALNTRTSAPAPRVRLTGDQLDQQIKSVYAERAENDRLGRIIAKKEFDLATDEIVQDVLEDYPTATRIELTNDESDHGEGADWHVHSVWDGDTNLETFDQYTSEYEHEHLVEDIEAVGDDLAVGDKRDTIVIDV